MFESKIKDLETKTSLSLTYRQKFQLIRVCGLDGDRPAEALQRAVDLAVVCKVPIRTLEEKFPEYDSAKLLRSVVEDFLRSGKQPDRSLRKTKEVKGASNTSDEAGRNLENKGDSHTAKPE